MRVLLRARRWRMSHPVFDIERPHRPGHRLEPRDRPRARAGPRTTPAATSCSTGATPRRPARRRRARRPPRGVRRHGRRGGRARRRPRSGRSTSSSTTRASSTASRCSSCPRPTGGGCSTRTSRARSWSRARPRAGWWSAAAARSSTSPRCRRELARPGIAAYAAAKGGLKMLTQSMCAEWGPAGVQANAIAPGLLRDRPHARARRGRGVQRLGARAHARGPLGTGRGARGDAPVPRLPRRRLRQRPDHLRRRRDVIGAVS